MRSVLLVSKPIAPPWNDSAKNLVRDVATYGDAFRYHLMTPRDAGEIAPGAVNERIYPGGGNFAPSLAQNARVLARLLRPDAIPLYHFFFAPNRRTSSVARTIFRLKRRRTLHTICSAPKSYEGIESILFAQRMVVLSNETRRRFAEVGVHDVDVVPPGIPIEALVDEGRRLAVRRELGLDDRPIVLFAGDYEFSRAAERTLEIARLVRQSCNAQLVLACRHKTAESPAIEAELRRRTEAWGIAESVRFVGQVSDIRALLAASRCVLMPAETLYAKMDVPLVLLEAMVQETPLVIADVAPLNELMHDPGLGARLPVDDLEGYANAVVAFLIDEAKSREAGARARAVVCEHYDARVMARRYEAIYTELLADAGE
ncbi:MAG: glycosyltransferase family 4 protein [Myxococcales bacterium]|nr:glycosyltransferase family 4 protein [Myxococcales bacterium]